MTGTKICCKATHLAPEISLKAIPLAPKSPTQPHCRHPATRTKPQASKLRRYTASRLRAKWLQSLVASPRARPKGLIGASSTGLECFPPTPKRPLKCVKTVKLSSISLFWPFQGRVLAPCGSQGSPMVPNVTPLVSQSHPLGSQMADIVILWGAHRATQAPQECQI